MQRYKFPLMSGVVAKSESKDWDEARKEWQLVDVYESEESESCLCGHFPIKEICVLRNEKNNNEIDVGNCCVKKIWNFGNDGIFKNIKEVKSNLTKSFNLNSLKLVLQKHIISQKDYNFYTDIWRKRLLSEKQEKWKVDINKRILSKMKFG